MPDSKSLNPDPPPEDGPLDDIGDRPAAHAVTQQSAPAADGVSVVNKRSAERIVVNGRAKAITSSGVIGHGKVIDVSQTGMCVLMEDSLAVKQIVTLDCNIFHNGRAHLFQIKALTVYAILSSGRFKVGFQFEPNSPVAKKIIEQLAS
jgi:hypothetical protein